MQEDTYHGDARDPLSLNLYTYCHNNPLIYFDPIGHILSLADKANLNYQQQSSIQVWTDREVTARANGDYERAEYAHKKAEEIRATADYSGGPDGSAYIPTSNNSSSNTSSGSSPKSGSSSNSSSSSRNSSSKSSRLTEAPTTL